MSYFKDNPFSKKIAALFFMAVLAIGTFMAAGVPVKADDDDRFVIIRGNAFSVRHDGKGPHIKVNGMKHYLEGDGDDRFVTVAGSRFNVIGDDDDDDDHDHDDDDDDDD